MVHELQLVKIMIEMTDNIFLIEISSYFSHTLLFSPGKIENN